MKNLSILGSTGSIGTNTLEIVAMFPDRFAVKALAAKKNVTLLAEQIERFSPAIAVVFDENRALALQKKIGPGSTTQILHGEEGYRLAASLDSIDMVVTAMVGASGLLPTLAAIEAGKDIALANKETLVMAGDIVIRNAKEKNIRILPIDSEHSAVFQCMAGHRMEDVHKIILTASGGPFLNWPKSKLHLIKPEDALNHPTWEMGNKISIDSATLMNKGLEVLEAKSLFGVTTDQIEVVIHPQSIVHSMVSYLDGAVMAQMGIPDMKGAIAYALSYPQRLPINQPIPDFPNIGALTFEKPDLEKFSCLKLALAAGNEGGTLQTVLNAANETAVDAFLNRRLAFTKIPQIIEKTMNHHEVVKNPDLDEILKTDLWARSYSQSEIDRQEIK